MPNGRPSIIASLCFLVLLCSAWQALAANGAPFSDSLARECVTDGAAPPLLKRCAHGKRYQVQPSATAVPARSPTAQPPIAASPAPVDINAMVQYVLRESYLETTEDLRHYAERVRFYNQQKKRIRSAIASAQTYIQQSGHRCWTRNVPPDVRRACDGIVRLERRYSEIDGELRRPPPR